ncbi:hypothetical protein ACLUWA_06660 [Bifidobacterium thermophilum]|uniref:hypothetical protein n=1 Tax=Bifidobacterium thermophilum TaxID=33905 RepID=UPI0039927B84
MVAEKEDKNISIILLAIGIFACIPVVRLGSYSLYIWLLIIGIIYCAIFQRFRLSYTEILPLVIAGTLTYIITYQSLSSSYAENDLKGMFALWLVLLASQSMLTESGYANALIQGVVIGGKINILWIFVQTLLSKAANIDINDLIFNQTLHMVEQASQIKASGLVSTGLCWNAGGIAAAIILVVALESTPWKLFAIVAAILTQSTTVLVGIAVVIIYLVFRAISNSKSHLRFSGVNILIICLIVSMVVGVIVCVPSVIVTLNSIWASTHDRLMSFFGNSELDSSATAHFDYYNNIPELIKRMDVSQFINGYGIDCSGLPYTKLTNQYFWLDSWFVESDIVNTLLGMGIMGIICLYYFLFSVVKVTRRNQMIILTFVTIAYIICGFFYNIQSVTYSWLILVEVAFCKAKFDIGVENKTK